eukprot:CAMPEP_0204291062 /NCGR_PEP_ID=MMETSP0468-20130131/61778_1 /ASSEMBLY_ACC=CAM_ASM_000383 /TAXON_ID=2969 /ORGANISM="Oxyrrhis marina" /LENGTH=35 /DNA_ID= /DNA_START= /DNA_END= /DNA_ORIENTATION=
MKKNPAGLRPHAVCARVAALARYTSRRSLACSRVG